VTPGSPKRQGTTEFVDAADLLKRPPTKSTSSSQNSPIHTTDAERSRRGKTRGYRLQARLAVALNGIDQAQTYLDESKDPAHDRARQKRSSQPCGNCEDCRGGRFESRLLAGSSLAGILSGIDGDTAKARAKLYEVINNALPAASDGRRVARIFAS